jgi:hypothetical protein
MVRVGAVVVVVVVVVKLVDINFDSFFSFFFVIFFYFVNIYAKIKYKKNWRVMIIINKFIFIFK